MFSVGSDGLELTHTILRLSRKRTRTHTHTKRTRVHAQGHNLAVIDAPPQRDTKFMAQKHSPPHTDQCGVTVHTHIDIHTYAATCHRDVLIIQETRAAVRNHSSPWLTS